MDGKGHGGGVETAVTCKKSLEKVRRLGGGTPLKLALDRVGSGEEKKEANGWVEKWDEGFRSRGD